MDSKFKHWFWACRPWSLTASFVPFAVCAPILFFIGQEISPPAELAWLRFFLALAGACILQIACNLLNSWGDYVSGVDLVDGAFVSAPQLVNGRISPRAMHRAGITLVALSAAIALAIAFVPPLCGEHINIPLVIAALSGVWGASNYTTGFRFKYRGLGLPFVFILMGPLYFIGVCAAFFGSVTAPGHTCDILIIAAAIYSIPVGMLVACIMHGNDMRDMISDGKAGIKTASTMLGPGKALALYIFLHCGGLACAIGILAATGIIAGGKDNSTSALHLLPAAIPLCAAPLVANTVKNASRCFRNSPDDPGWRGLERDTGKIHFLLGLLYAASLLILVLV